MRTTVSIPDDLAHEVRELAGGRPSELTREALQERVERLKRRRLARKLEEGYRSEAREPSLDPKWVGVETEGLGSSAETGSSPTSIPSWARRWAIVGRLPSERLEELRTALDRHLWF